LIIIENEQFCDCVIVISREVVVITGGGENIYCRPTSKAHAQFK